jgi:hypothetical protein
MKRLLRLHRYLSLLVAPAMLFFAISGAWQAFRYQETKKDGSYTAPAALTTLSQVHMAEKLKGPAAPWFRAAQLTIAALFVATALVGIVMALQITRPVWLVWLCLAAGAAVPALLAIVARAG